jgi:uncharacterized protein with HEPN domain
MSKRDLDLLLDDILECIQNIKSYTKGYNFDAFLKDKKTIDAVARNFITIGEATANIDADFKYANTQIDWKKIKNFRNRMVHDYIGTDYEVVWDVVSNHIEELEFQIVNLIKEIE